ncbi:unnamed protein product [Closterium sp. NIES-53]
MHNHRTISTSHSPQRPIAFSYHWRLLASPHLPSALPHFPPSQLHPARLFPHLPPAFPHSPPVPSPPGCPHHLLPVCSPISFRLPPSRAAKHSQGDKHCWQDKDQPRGDTRRRTREPRTVAAAAAGEAAGEDAAGEDAAGEDAAGEDAAGGKEAGERRMGGGDAASGGSSGDGGAMEFPVFCVQWAVLPGASDSLHIFMPHYVLMFEKLLAGPPPHLYVHLLLPPTLRRPPPVLPLSRSSSSKSSRGGSSGSGSGSSGESSSSSGGSGGGGSSGREMANEQGGVSGARKRRGRERRTSLTDALTGRIGTLMHVDKVKRFSDGRMLIDSTAITTVRVNHLLQTIPYCQAQVQEQQDQEALLLNAFIGGLEWTEEEEGEEEEGRGEERGEQEGEEGEGVGRGEGRERDGAAGMAGSVDGMGRVLHRGPPNSINRRALQRLSLRLQRGEARLWALLQQCGAAFLPLAVLCASYLTQPHKTRPSLPFLFPYFPPFLCPFRPCLVPHQTRDLSSRLRMDGSFPPLPPALLPLLPPRSHHINPSFLGGSMLEGAQAQLMALDGRLWGKEGGKAEGGEEAEGEKGKGEQQGEEQVGESCRNEGGEGREGGEEERQSKDAAQGTQGNNRAQDKKDTPEGLPQEGRRQEEVARQEKGHGKGGREGAREVGAMRREEPLLLVRRVQQLSFAAAAAVLGGVERSEGRQQLLEARSITQRIGILTALFLRSRSELLARVAIKRSFSD